MTSAPDCRNATAIAATPAETVLVEPQCGGVGLVEEADVGGKRRVRCRLLELVDGQVARRQPTECGAAELEHVIVIGDIVEVEDRIAGLVLRIVDKCVIAGIAGQQVAALPSDDDFYRQESRCRHGR